MFGFYGPVNVDIISDIYFLCHVYLYRSLSGFCLALGIWVCEKRGYLVNSAILTRDPVLGLHLFLLW